MMLNNPTARLPVSPAAQRAAHTLTHMPLGTVDHLAQARGLSPSTMYPALREVKRAGLATSTAMGAARGKLEAWFFTQSALEIMGLRHDSWHLPGERARLLEHFPLTDRFYRAANSRRDMGQLKQFSWFSGLSLDAAATYERGWVALFWSGRLETGRGLTRRLTRLGQHMVDYSLTEEPAWPAMLYWVVDDQWQRELVLRACRRFGLQDQVAIWCVADNTVAPPRSPQVSRGGLYQDFEPRSLGTWSWERRVEASLWHPANGRRLEAAIRVVAEWPGCKRALVQAATREADRKRAEQCLRELLGRQWLRRDDVRGIGRYSITSKSQNILARLDRTANGKPAMTRHLPAWERPGLSRSHEDCVMDLAARFMAAGLVVSAGWRSWEHMGAHGAIKPDAMVLLTHSLYGPGWCYLEYEQSARRTYKLTAKLRGYSSDRRHDDWPLLVVAWDDEAERILHQLGRERRIHMITTTRKRVATHEAVGSAAIWSMYGTPAPID